MRDLGVGLRGERRGCSAYFMAGNGLGANQYLAGRASDQYIDANAFGASYTWKILDSRTDPDIRDDAIILALQLRY